MTKKILRYIIVTGSLGWSGLFATDTTASKSDASTDNPEALAPTFVTADKDPYVSPSTITGGAETSKQIPNTITVITQQRIQDENLVTIADALNQVPGITVISNDSTQSQYYARGYTLDILNDGIPSYGALSGYQQFDLAIYNRIEVLHGPGGILEGTGSLGGLVNVVPKRPGADFDAWSAISAGSWDNYRGEVDVSSPLNKSKTVRALFVGVLQDRKFFYDKSRNSREVGYGDIEWEATRHTTISVSVADQDDLSKIPYSGLPAWTTGGLLNVPRSTNPYPNWTKYSWKSQNYQVEAEQRFESGWVAILKYNRRDQDFYFKDAYPSTGLDPVAKTLTYARRQYDYNYWRDGADFYATGPINIAGRPQNLTVGYNYDAYAYNYVGVKATAITGVPFGLQDQYVSNFDLPYNLGGKLRTAQKGYFAQARLNVIDPLKVVLGARTTSYSTKSQNAAPATPTPWSFGATAHNHLTPYAGLIYDITKVVSLYGSYSNIFVPQSQLKASGGALDPRIGRQDEVGAKADFLNGKLEASVAAFELEDTNRAYADPNNTGYYLNAGRVESKGWETQVSGSPAAGYEIQGGYTLLKTKYAVSASNQGLTYDTWEPEHQLKLWALRHFSGSDKKGLTIGVGVNWVSGSQAGLGTSAIRSQNSYSVVSALVDYKFTPNLSVNLNANNLFDTTYYTRLGGTNTYNSYGDPRNFTLTLRYNFN